MGRDIQTGAPGSARKTHRCEDCKNPLGRGNTSGRCRGCFNRRLWAGAGDRDLVDKLRGFATEQLARLFAHLDRERVREAVELLDHDAAGAAGT